ncbi:hypothetical protein O181_106472 [Austropuccinia psidii MF-1]|uniref:Uncharacterized protein n=1 Tax=Austropuccinia psidii MF-1 TaxID=1389203 RepID=A0A9Q3JQH4_9BASI|nr:hypothetical protein [Austropuccinia psidii MF-1]
MSQFSEKNQENLAKIQENNVRMEELTASQTKTVKTVQEHYAKLSKTSEETKKRLNQVLVEQNHCKMDKECNVLDNPYHQEDIKPDALLKNKPRSPSQYQDGDNLTYSEKEALRNLPEDSSWPNFSGVGEYDSMELIDYIDRLFIDVPSIPDYWFTARLNIEFEGQASIWYTQMKEINGRRNWPWWKSQIINKDSNGTWIWQKAMSFEKDKYSVQKDPYEWCLRQSKRLRAIDPQMKISMTNHKLLKQM